MRGARLQLANALIFAAIFTEEREPQEAGELLRRAEPVVHRALSLDPELSEAHGAYANLLRSLKKPGAEEQYQRALELNPNNAASCPAYAVFLSAIPGREDESDRATARALELDPRQPNTWANYLANLGGDMHDPHYRAEFERGLRMVADMPGAIDRFTMPELALPGFPVEIMRAAAMKHRTPTEQNLPTWVNRYRAWIALIERRVWDERRENPEAIERELRGEKGRGWLMRWLPSRAHDNGLFLVFSNGVGIDDDEVRTGNAMVLDPYGRILAETWKAGDDVVVADLDASLLEKATGRLWMKARRPDLYRELSVPTGHERDTYDLKLEE